MTETSQHDAWRASDSYDVYMGRWSRVVASLFLDWLGAEPDRDWLDVGCGTGALTSAIVARCSPKSVVSLDMSDSFIAKARASLGSGKVDFRVGNGGVGIVAQLPANGENALAEARRVARSGGLIGFYVWDYPGHGLEFVDAFWAAATSLDAPASALDEARRFPFCTPDGLSKTANDAGLTSVEWIAIEVPTVFKDFEAHCLT